MPAPVRAGSVPLLPCLQPFQFVGRQTERLPALSVVAAFLHVADRRAEQGGTVLLCHGEQRELTVEMYELLDDYLLHVAAAAFHGCVESHLQFIGALHDALSVARRRHQRLYYDGKPISFERLFDYESNGIQVVPSAKAVNYTMNRKAIRDLAAKELGLRTAKYFYAKTLDELKAHSKEIGFPCVVSR